LAVAALAALGFGTSCSPLTGNPGPPTGSPADTRTVLRVVDGDTLIVEPKERIRLIGVDAPESVAPARPVECMAREASRFLSELLPKGTAVQLEYDVERLDRYGRTLAYVWVNSTGLFVNAELIRRGFAQPLTIPPNVAHADRFADLALEARGAARGLWGSCPVPAR
jgi:micrococcal nuclease